MLSRPLARHHVCSLWASCLLTLTKSSLTFETQSDPVASSTSSWIPNPKEVSESYTLKFCFLCCGNSLGSGKRESCLTSELLAPAYSPPGHSGTMRWRLPRSFSTLWSSSFLGVLCSWAQVGAATCSALLSSAHVHAHLE